MRHNQSHLWSSASSAGPSHSAEWFAIQTRPRHEKRIFNELTGRKHITAFVPTVRAVHRWSDRRKVVEVPLFSCYVFVQVHEWRHAYYQVLRTSGVLRWVGRHGEPTTIPDSQIEAVRSTLASGLAASPYPFLKLGQRVRIRGGCLDGVEGFLTGIKDDSRLVISVDIIQQSMAVEIRGYEIVPA